MRRVADVRLAVKDRRAITAAATVLKASFPVREMVLFGSKARGETRQDADTDLLVLTTRKLAWAERTAMIDALFDLQLQYDVIISLLIIPADEWFSGVYQVLPIREEIERDGVRM
ncbi:MAG: nucleotidyltransferase domain-containing protein [Phycisphaerae bacterium]